MRRKKPLRARTPLQRKKALRSTKGLARGTSQLKRTPLKPGKPLRRGRWNRASWEQWGQLDRLAHAAWKGATVRRRCERCLREGRKHDSSPKRDPHHILPARYLRAYVRSLKLPADEARALLRSLMFDKRNGMSLCRRCHDRQESGFDRVPRAMVSRKALQFAEELGLAHVIERLYPSGPAGVAQSQQ